MFDRKAGQNDWYASHNSRLFRIGQWRFSWGIHFHLFGDVVETPAERERRESAERASRWVMGLPPKGWEVAETSTESEMIEEAKHFCADVG